MNATLRLLCVAVMLLMTTHRLPAPIVENQEQPPMETAPKVKAPPKHKTSESSSEKSSARRFDGTWHLTSSSKNQAGSTFNTTITLVIKSGSTADFTSETTATTVAGKPWSDLPAPYNSSPTIYKKWTDKSMDLRLEGSNLKVRWPGSKLIDWKPKGIPVAAFKNAAGQPESVLYILSGDKLIATNGQRTGTFTRIR